MKNMLTNIRNLWKHRELLWVWTAREVRVRYKQSLLGVGWAILQPLAFTLMFTLVFSFVVQVPTDGIPYPIFSFTAMLPWTMFATAINFGVSSLVGNMNLVTKIYFPREVLPLAAIAAAFVDFLVASLIYIVMLLWYRMPIYPTALLLPVLVAVQLALTIGVVLLGAAGLVFYRDIRFLVPLGLQLWLYASPVIYPASMIPAQWQWLYQLNPMVGILEGYRAILLHGQWPPTSSLATATVISVAVLLAGYAWFKRAEPAFADLI
jgi:lipopolysaccharide transport system permease protein